MIDRKRTVEILLLVAVIITAGGHFLTDYILQKTRLGMLKRRYFAGLLLHAALWTAAMCPGLGLLGVFAPWKACFLLVTHALVDYVKMKLKPGKLRVTHPCNIADQLLHVLTVIIVFSI